MDRIAALATLLLILLTGTTWYVLKRRAKGEIAPSASTIPPKEVALTSSRTSSLPETMEDSSFLSATGSSPESSPENTTEEPETERGKTSRPAVTAVSQSRTTTAPPKDPAAGDPDTYLIYVSKNAFTVAILERDEAGEYTRVVKLFPAATGGTATRSGSFEIQHLNQKSTKLRWYSFNTSFAGHCPYATYYSGKVYFHGPIFRQKDPHSLNTKFYNRIGSVSTSGCLRLATAHARWIYYNCPFGTKVTVANDKRYQAPVHQMIPEDQFWDPTDPDARPPVTAFQLNVSDLEIQLGQSFLLTVTDVQPANTGTQKFLFVSEQPEVVSVTSGGRLEALMEGTALIRVTADDLYALEALCLVTVVPVQGSEEIPEG